MNPPASLTPQVEIPRSQRIASVLWPAFLVAGLLEMVLFACWDPLDLHWFGRTIDWSRDTVYSVGFLILWAGCSLSAWLTLSMAGSSVRRAP